MKNLGVIRSSFGEVIPGHRALIIFIFDSSGADAVCWISKSDSPFAIAVSVSALLVENARTRSRGENDLRSFVFGDKTIVEIPIGDDLGLGGRGCEQRS